MANEQKVLEADMRASQWLAQANQLIEAGKAGTKAHKEAERKAQYWLDRLNKLEGYRLA